MSNTYAKYKRLAFDRPHPNVLRITINNPDAHNSIDDVMHPELVQIWRDADEDESVSAIIITGAGKNFCTGGNFDSIQKMVSDFDHRALNWKQSRDVVYNMMNCSKPIVSAVRGAAVGGGLVCALLADISIAAKEARLIDGHMRLGLPAGDHAALIWPLLCGLARAKYHLLLGDTVTGEEAERIGLVSLAVPDAELDQKSVETAIRLAEGPAGATRLTKYAMNNWLRMAGPSFDASLALEFFWFSSNEMKEGLSAHREKREPRFPQRSPV
jgi:enoyl-CoA hydratase